MAALQIALKVSVRKFLAKGREAVQPPFLTLLCGCLLGLIAVGLVASCQSRGLNASVQSGSGTARLKGLDDKLAGKRLKRSFPVAVIGKAVITERGPDDVLTDNPNFVSGEAAEDLLALLRESADPSHEPNVEPEQQTGYRFVGCQLSQLAQLVPGLSDVDLKKRVLELLKPDVSNFFQPDKTPEEAPECGSRVLEPKGKSPQYQVEFFLDKAQVDLGENEGDLVQVIGISRYGIGTGNLTSEISLFRRTVSLFQSAPGDTDAPRSAVSGLSDDSSEFENELVLLITRPVSYDQKWARRLLFPAKTPFSQVDNEEFKTWYATALESDVEKVTDRDARPGGYNQGGASDQAGSASEKLTFRSPALYALGLDSKWLQRLQSRLPEEFSKPDSLYDISRRFALMEHLRKGAMLAVRASYALLAVNSAPIFLEATSWLIHGTLVPGAQAGVLVQAVASGATALKAVLDSSGLVRWARMTGQNLSAAQRAILASDITAMVLMTAGSGAWAVLNNEAAFRFVTDAWGGMMGWLNGAGSQIPGVSEAGMRLLRDNLPGINERLSQMGVLAQQARSVRVAGPVTIKSVQVLGQAGQNVYGQIQNAVANYALVRSFLASSYEFTGPWHYYYSHRFNYRCPAFALNGMAIGGWWGSCIDYVQAVFRDFPGEIPLPRGYGDREAFQELLNDLVKEDIAISIDGCTEALQKNGREFCKQKGNGCRNACINSAIKLFKNWSPGYYECLWESQEKPAEQKKCLVEHGSGKVVNGEDKRFKSAL